MSFGGSRRAALAALCVTEVVSYGVLFYAFPVLAGDIVADTGWSRTAVTAAFSADGEGNDETPQQVSR